MNTNDPSQPAPVTPATDVPATEHQPPAAEAAPPADPPAAAVEPVAPAAVADAPASVAEVVTVAPATEPEPPLAPAAPALPPQPVPAVPPSPQPSDLSRIAQDLQIRKVQVEALVQLLDEGNTVPFITRYRKERTGGLDEEVIRRIQTRIDALRALAERKQTILKSIAGQGRLTDGIAAAVLDADHPKRLEDLYQPFKPKRRSLSSDAKEQGLEPLALAIWHRDAAVEPLAETVAGLVNPDKGLTTPDAVLAGVKHILAELISDSADVRGSLRLFLRDTAVMGTNKIDGVPDGQGAEYRDYFQFKEPVRMMPPHRILAVNRGEHEKFIRVKLECDTDRAKFIAEDNLPVMDHPHLALVREVVSDAIDRLILPSLEREIRKEMTEFAQDNAVDIFARNLQSLLLRAPLGGKRVLAIDPGMRTGCKVAVLDETGVPLEDAVIFPHPPQKKPAEAKRKLEQLIRKHQTAVIAIGNGTGCRETEQLVAELIADLENRRLNPRPAASPIPQAVAETPTVTVAVPDVAATHTVEMPASVIPAAETVSSSVVTTGTEAATVSTEAGAADAAASSHTAVAAPKVPAAPPPPEPVLDLTGLPDAPTDIAYVIVNEAGASDYSASPIAKEEFPNLDATGRGTISIGRRLQDPLAELVKIDPQHVGVGLYQHDMRPKYLKESLETVIESCVNAVGVDLNTASVPLLRHVSGLNQLAARELVEFRKRNGPFRSREQLTGVPQMGPARFTQAAGFLKIRDGEDPLDNTWVHPESYPIARYVLDLIGHPPADLRDRAKLADIAEKLRTQNPEAIANHFKVGGPTVRDIFEALTRTGRDIREDRPTPIFRKGVLKPEDLTPGMELKGEILNVVPFGAFIDIGLKESGLVHISQMANRFIKSPYDVVSVGDVVPVWVLDVAPGDKKIKLTMIPPGQERGRDRPRGDERQPMDRRDERQPMDRRDDRAPMGQRPPAPQQRRDDRPPQQQPSRPPAERGGFAPRPGPGGPPMGQGQGPRPGPGGPPMGQGQRPPQQGGYRGGPPQGGGGYRGGPPQGGQGSRPGGPSRQDQGPPPGYVPPPPPKPSKPRPMPKLSDDQKAGAAALNSFGQLAVFFGGPVADAPPPQEPEDKKKKKREEKLKAKAEAEAKAAKPPEGETKPADTPAVAPTAEAPPAAPDNPPPVADAPAPTDAPPA